MTETLGKAVAITQAASTIPMSYFRKVMTLEAKSDTSPVTIADRETEQFIRAELMKAFPNDGILGEEFGVIRAEAEAIWVVDPIDGTRSFITGSPMFGMLLGRVVAGKPEIGIVRMPALNETFTGAPGMGATLNGMPIVCRKTKRLADAMIYVNEAERITAANPDLFRRLTGAGHTRRMAYDCYSHALVAAGQIDAVVDYGLEPYDYLPLIALIEAAGGLICDWQGQPLTMKSDGRVITACTPELRDEVLALLTA